MRKTETLFPSGVFLLLNEKQDVFHSVCMWENMREITSSLNHSFNRLKSESKHVTKRRVIFKETWILKPRSFKGRKCQVKM